MVIDVVAEKKAILKEYRKLLRAARPVLKDNDAKIIKKAFNTSLEAHKEMRRKSGEPYIFHPLAVAQICVEEIGLGTTAIVCALLHDVVEDTDIEVEDIEQIFGKKVAQMVDGLTKISGIFDTGTSQQAENFRKMLLTLADDIRVILIKLADRLHNMRTLGSMARDKQLKIASETAYLYAPLAHRLGLYAIKTELEDLHLKYTDPATYRGIAAKLRETKLTRDKFVREFIKPIEEALNHSEFAQSYTIKGRPKSIYSIWNKIKKQHTPFEEIYDLFAIRIILDVALEQEKATCWSVYSIVTDTYVPNPKRLRDWISTPKANGYESLHTTVMSKTGQWVEVQVRSLRMDEIAEKGVAAHFKYKGNDTQTNSKGLDYWLSEVRANFEKQDHKSTADFLEDFRGSLYSEEVFVFTPKGDLKVLPSGSSALDFAFDIHSEVGARCIGAKVNQKLVSINHVLKNGDQLEILTSKKQKPSEDWLNFVITSKAKARIKEYIKEENKQYVSDGKDLVIKQLKLLNIELTNEVQNQLRAYFNCKESNDLFYRFGKSYLRPEEIKRWKADREAHERRQENKLKLNQPIQDGKTFEKEIKRIHGERTDADMLLIGEDMDKIDYNLAKCCSPISGDDVFGFVTINEGIKIHRTTCNNALELMSNHGNRVIKAKWTSQVAIAFLTELRIKGTDRIGLVNSITQIISGELKVNMRSITVETDNGLFEGNIKVYVHDTAHLEILRQKLEVVEGVFEVVRFDNLLV